MKNILARIFTILDEPSYGGAPLSIESSSKRTKPDAPVSLLNLDADEPANNANDDTDDEDEDDTAELMAELNRIKKEREAEQV